MTPRLELMATIIKSEEEVEKCLMKIGKITAEIHRENFKANKELTVKKFMSQWGEWFASRQIRFEDWSDICKEGLELTLKFIESDLEDFKDLEGAKELIDKQYKRMGELGRSGEYTLEEISMWHEMGY